MLRPGIDVRRLPRMARAKERHLRLRVTEARNASARDEWHRLERLQRTSRRRQKLRIARGVEQVAVAINDGDRSIVNRIDGVTPARQREWSVRRCGVGGHLPGRGRRVPEIVGHSETAIIARLNALSPKVLQFPRVRAPESAVSL